MKQRHTMVRSPPQQIKETNTQEGKGREYEIIGRNVECYLCMCWWCQCLRQSLEWWSRKKQCLPHSQGAHQQNLPPHSVFPDPQNLFPHKSGRLTFYSMFFFPSFSFFSFSSFPFSLDAEPSKMARILPPPHPPHTHFHSSPQ